MKYNETITYYDELNDDFANKIKHVKPLPKRYKIYSKNPFFLLFNFIMYWIIVRPIAFFYMKFRFHYKIRNKKILKNLKHQGYLIFANHTLIMGDAFSLNLVDLRRRNYIVTGEETNSLKKILPLLRSLGLLPVTKDLKRNKELIAAIKYITKKKKNTVTIFPEAHIWPYYTDIRNFRFESFKYAVLLDIPVVTLTNCYSKKKHGKRPKITGYLAGPFYPDKTLNKKDAAIKLRNDAYSSMKENKKYSSYSYYNYVRGNKDE